YVLTAARATAHGGGGNPRSLRKSTKADAPACESLAYLATAAARPASSVEVTASCRSATSFDRTPRAVSTWAWTLLGTSFSKASRSLLSLTSVSKQTLAAVRILVV